MRTDKTSWSLTLLMECTEEEAMIIQDSIIKQFDGNDAIAFTLLKPIEDDNAGVVARECRAKKINITAMVSWCMIP